MQSVAAAVILLAIGATAPAAETVRVSALDCVFEIPANYEIDVAPNSSVVMSAPGRSLGPRIRISELEPAVQPTESTELRERVATGPLTVERFRHVLKGQTASPSIDFTIVRGRRQQAKFDDMSDAQVDEYVSQCLNSMTPAVRAASDRKTEGCKSTLPMQEASAAMGEGVLIQPVFANGELRGWRLYGIRNSEQLRTRGITEGSLVTHVCAVPAREIFVNDNAACCSVDASKQFELTIQVSGKPTQVSISRAP